MTIKTDDELKAEIVFRQPLAAAALHDIIDSKASVGSGGSGVTRSGSTVGDHLAVWNGSNADSLKDGGVVPEGGGGGGGSSIGSGNYADRLVGSNGDLYLARDGHHIDQKSDGVWTAFGPLARLVLPPAVSAWEQVNWGNSSADDTKGPLIMKSQVSGGQTLRALQLTAPTAPYTVTALLSCDNRYQWPSWMGCGIGVRDSATGRSVMFGPSNADTGNGISLMRWVSPTGYMNSYFADSTFFTNPIWLRIQDDGMNLNFFYSVLGVEGTWMQRFTVSRSDFLATPDKICVILYQEHGSVQSSATLWSWEVT